MPPTTNDITALNDKKNSGALRFDSAHIHQSSHGISEGVNLTAVRPSFLVTGLAGVRGLIENVAPPIEPGETASRAFLKNRAKIGEQVYDFKESLRTAAVLRAHAFVPSSLSPEETKIWKKWGFERAETPLFLLDLSTIKWQPVPQPLIHPDKMTIGPARREEIEDFIPQLLEEPAVGFLDWEADAIRSATPSNRLDISVLRYKDAPLAISIGGRTDNYVTITHLYVCPDVRQQKLGKWFVHSLLTKFAEEGAKTAYVMVGEDFAPALKFWSTLRFGDNPTRSYLCARIARER